MKFRLPNNFSRNVPNLVRKAGYFQIFDQKSGKGSYIRKVGANRYPRFHLYITESEAEVVFDLHLDQSATRYNNQTAHNADYESEEVKQELTRIYQAIKPFRV